MDCREVSGASEIQERQVYFLARSLNTMRVAEKSDVVIECGERQFYAHKVILEASSPYFTTMFHSNLEEATTGKIIFKDMEPETIEAILDFLYLGDVKKISTDFQFMNVFKASHMMELPDLFQYCSNRLSKVLSPENFLAIWNLAEKYDEKLLVEVKNYFQTHTTLIITSSNDFLSATANQLKELAINFRSKPRNMDMMLKAIVYWGLHDLPNRENFTEELFTYIDRYHVSKQFARLLLHDSKLTTLSTKLANRLKDLIIDVCFAEEGECAAGRENFPQLELETIRLQFADHKLFFLMQENITKADGATTEPNVNVDNYVTYVQIFDLDSMSWQPKNQLPFVKFKVDAVCLYKRCVFMIGSTGGNVYILYDLSNNSLNYVNTRNNLSTPTVSACYFKNTVYLIGGNANDDTSPCTPVDLEEPHKRWVKTSPLNVGRRKPLLFTSEDYMFVAGGTSSLSQQVEYTNGVKKWLGQESYDEMTWTVAELPNNLIHADVHFFSYENRLCGLYSFNDTLMKLTYMDKNWNAQALPTSKIRREMKVKGFYHFQTRTNPLLLVLPTDVSSFIPDYVLKIESLNWCTLPRSKGKCEMKKDGHFLSTSCYLPQRD